MSKQEESLCNKEHFRRSMEGRIVNDGEIEDLGTNEDLLQTRFGCTIYIFKAECKKQLDVLSKLDFPRSSNFVADLHQDRASIPQPMAPHAHNGVDNIAYTASMMEKAKLDLSAQFPAKDRSPPSTMLARPLFPVADKIRQKNSTDEVSSPSPWEKLPVIATYADATNLAMRFPQLAFEVLNRPLLSSYNVEKKEPEPEVESTPMTLSPMVAPAPPPVKVPAHTPGKPNWALAPEDEPCLPAAAQFTRGGGYKRGRGTQRANNYRQSRTNPTCFPEFQVKDYEAYTSDPTGVQGLETFEAYAVAPGAARASTVVEPVWSRCDNIHPDSNHAETYTESNSNSNVNITYQPSSIVPSWNNTDVVPNEAPVQDNHYSHQAAAPGLTGPIRDCLSPYMRERFKAILPGVRDLPPHVGREPHLRTRESKSAAAERSIQGEWYTADNGWAGAPVLRQQSAQDHVAPTPAPARAQYAYLPEKDMIMSDPAPQDKWRASNGSWTASPSQQERQPTHQEPVQQKPAAIADRYKCEEDFEKTTDGTRSLDCTCCGRSP
ncbi:hypothetical protein BDQ12DRAFT_731741 [Crucibulum laeve]|uniref:Uncharacterized protein n=1 Tax=Crucibulum laeve TaxID=68775 RepID=A0A5C3MFQ6_9AGAR|nr:hypothetical protein BDQ12DRAFT_731741 [Crucibulum laeve]